MRVQGQDCYHYDHEEVEGIEGDDQLNSLLAHAVLPSLRQEAMRVQDQASFQDCSRFAHEEVEEDDQLSSLLAAS